LKPLKLITLTTDFGHSSSYVGQMKGAALVVDSGLHIIDLCHEVPPQQIAAGAYLLEAGYAAFPRGTIHVAVVDPGVGTGRRAVAARAGNYFFLAPDNGLLTRVLRREALEEAHVIEAPAYRRSPVSPTFEGRDVFAPAAAGLASGLALRELGPPVGELKELPDTRARLESTGRLEVQVLFVDGFGNVTLDVTERELARLLGSGPLRLETPHEVIDEFHRTYQEGSSGAPFLLVNSAGYLEVAIYGGRAADALRLSPGIRLTLTTPA
jgi:S-adenosylmethionine hydrolase